MFVFSLKAEAKVTAIRISVTSGRHQMHNTLSRNVICSTGYQPTTQYYKKEPPQQQKQQRTINTDSGGGLAGGCFIELIAAATQN